MAPTSTYTQEDNQQEVVTYTAAEDESLSDAVIAAMKLVSNCVASPKHAGESQNLNVLEPIFETIDLDALDALFSSSGDDSTTTGTVTFTHAGYEVSVTNTGEISVIDE